MATPLLGQLLREVSFTQIDHEFLSSMSVASVDSTIGGRLKRADMQGKIFINTGTLSDLRAIAGYVAAKSRQIYAVVGLVNASKCGAGCVRVGSLY
jgi:serine-type D-Ala-D-Ala carboxypeptidase/endopeptidase (penicillin-binding protein 4)